MTVMPIEADRTRRVGRTDPELLGIGDGAWVACDPTVSSDDPRRVIAYLECKDDIVYLLWVRDYAGVHEYSSIREALDAMGQSMAARRSR